MAIKLLHGEDIRNFQKTFVNAKKGKFRKISFEIFLFPSKFKFSYAQCVKTFTFPVLTNSPQDLPKQPTSLPVSNLAGISDLKSILSEIAMEISVPNFNELTKLYRSSLEHIKQTNN